MVLQAQKEQTNGLMDNDQPPRETPEERFNRILREYGPPLMRLVASYEGNVSEREDLFQEICLAIWQALPRFRNECSERTFVFRISHNRGLSHRWRRKPRMADLQDAEAVADPMANPEVDAYRAQRYRRLMAAVRCLPDIQHQVIVLSLEGLANREVAEVLGTTENNVAVRLTRARKALRTLLEETGGRP